MTLKFGILGDSDTDSYQGDDARGGDFAHVAFCAPEILVRLRSFDLGAWGTYSEPRRTDYAYNWSRSGATSHTMISAGQHTGLAAQVSNGDVEYCFIDIGTNNFHPGHSSPSLYEEVYDGTLSGSALQGEIDDCIGDMEDAMDALINAGALGVVVALWHQWSDEVAAGYGFTNGTNRQRVTDTIDAINAGIVSACNSREIPYVEGWDDILDWMGGAQGSSPEYVEIGGRQITITAGDEPYNVQLSDTHLGTVAQCVMTNEMVIRPLNEHYDAGIAMLTEAEMLDIAGLLFPTTPVLDDFNRADGGLGGDWGAIVPGVGVQPLAISSNEAAPSASGVCAEYWSGESFGADCEVYVTLAAAPGTGNGVAVGARVADPGSVSTYDGYDVVYTQSGGTDTIVVRRVTDVVPTTILTINLDLSAGDKLGMSLVGDLIRVYVDDGDGWVSVGEVLDSTYENQGGYLVIATTSGTAARLDDFGGGDVVEPALPIVAQAADGLALGVAASPAAMLVGLGLDGLAVGAAAGSLAQLAAEALDGLAVGAAAARRKHMTAGAVDGLAMGAAPGNRANFGGVGSDGLLMSDAGAARASLVGTAADNLTLGEALAAAAILAALGADDVVFGETATGERLGALVAEALDGLRLGEAASAGAQLLAAAADGLQLGETTAALAQLLAAAADAMALGEAASGTMGAQLIEAMGADGLAFGDVASVAALIEAVAVDGVVFDEDGALRANFVVEAGDGLVFAEAVQAVMALVAAATDGLAMGDAAVTIEATGVVHVTFSARRAEIGFTVMRPGAGFEGRRPGVDFEANSEGE